mmetsp:Transcript_11312/g.37780  ORF Transcript_11312/g.37780 Transcript_11312/m.37780 type:complete len:273 (+) Transcript_11312:346-1164(+)
MVPLPEAWERCSSCTSLGNASSSKTLLFRTSASRSPVESIPNSEGTYESQLSKLGSVVVGSHADAGARGVFVAAKMTNFFAPRWRRGTTPKFSVSPPSPRDMTAAVKPSAFGALEALEALEAPAFAPSSSPPSLGAQRSLSGMTSSRAPMSCSKTAAGASEAMPTASASENGRLLGATSAERSVAFKANKAAPKANVSDKPPTLTVSDRPFDETYSTLCVLKRVPLLSAPKARGRYFRGSPKGASDAGPSTVPTRTSLGMSCRRGNTKVAFK